LRFEVGIPVAAMNSLTKNFCDLRAFVTFVKKPWLVRLGRLQLIAAMALALTGCASVHATSKPADRPALVVPSPPPRIIEPAEVAPEPVADIPPPPLTPPSSGAARPGRSAAPKPATEVKPETKPPVDPKPVEQIPAELSPKPEAKPDAQLRTPETADATGATRTVQTTIDRARTILSSVNFAPLSNERKKAYNDAKLLIQQAEDSLKRGNLGIAQGVASKAETLAKELAGK
jgi:hypothetical protein